MASSSASNPADDCQDAASKDEVSMDDFTQFQLKEYENISQADIQPEEIGKTKQEQ